MRSRGDIIGFFFRLAFIEICVGFTLIVTSFVNGSIIIVDLAISLGIVYGGFITGMIALFCLALKESIEKEDF